MGNSNAKKLQRRVEIGWLDFEFTVKEFRQVKAPGGGGTKHENFHIESTVASILEEAKLWFFENGRNGRGL